MLAYIFDLDGTLFDITHRLHFIDQNKSAAFGSRGSAFAGLTDSSKPHGASDVQSADWKPDWDGFFAACVDDKAIEPICHLAHSLMQREPVLFVSGRSDQVRAQTEQCLRQHVAPPALLAARTKLYMRKAGDHRPDHLVKAEILTQIRLDGFEPIMAFDDRKQVVDMWRAAGVTCAQVAEGNF